MARVTISKAPAHSAAAAESGQCWLHFPIIRHHDSMALFIGRFAKIFDHLETFPGFFVRVAEQNVIFGNAADQVSLTPWQLIL